MIADAPAPDSQFEIDLDEQPHCPRPDVRALNFRCDQNGDLKHEPSKLEKRGTTSQAELFSKATAHKFSVVAKLREIGRPDLADPLAECHTIESCRVCVSCRTVVVFMNRCERHYCPECAPRLARERRESVEWWAREIREPKHVVLTTRNTDALTKNHVRWFKQCLSKLRRRKFARNWRGGFYRLEVTNESKGWHLHAHLLVDAGWISGAKLATEWADVVGQELAIVKVKDVHSRDYLAEVTKYTVKGSQLATWTGAAISEFIDALDGVRTFGVFGSLYGKRTEWAEWIKSLREQGPICACGCHHFKILSPQELAWENLRRESGVLPTQPGAPDQEPLLPSLQEVPERPQQHWIGQL